MSHNVYFAPALLIGIDNYENPAFEATHAVNDAGRVEAVLREYWGMPCTPGADLTKHDAENLISKWTKQVDQRATQLGTDKVLLSIFFYAGHSHQQKDSCLPIIRASDSDPEATENDLSLDTMLQDLSRAGRNQGAKVAICIIMDSCRDGLGPSLFTRRTTNRAAPHQSACWGNLEQRMPRSSTDFLFLLATDPSDVVMVNEGGHFTTALVEGLRESGVSLGSLYDFCHWEFPFNTE